MRVLVPALAVLLLGCNPPHGAGAMVAASPPVPPEPDLSHEPPAPRLFAAGITSYTEDALPPARPELAHGVGARRIGDLTIEQGEVSEPVSEVVSSSPPGGESRDGSYAWTARMNVRVDPEAERIYCVVRVLSDAPAAVRARWRRAILDKWNRRVELVVGETRYLVRVDVAWQNWAPDGGGAGRDDPERAHYAIRTARGRDFFAGTRSLDEWGETDTIGVTHEFGHMLGNPDEYFTTNGVTYAQALDESVMGSSLGPALPRHFELIRRAATRELGLSDDATTIQPAWN